VFLAALTLGSQIEGEECPYLWEYSSPECNDGYALNGYWWYGSWVPGLPTLESWFSGSPEVAIGNATFYGPGIMAATAEARGLSLRGYVDGVSALSCADLGLGVWLQRPGHSWEGPYLVVDCAQRNDIYGTIVIREEVIEVGFDTARRWGMVRAGAENYAVLAWRVAGVTVSKIPPGLVEETATPLRSWWLRRLSLTTPSDFREEMRNGWTRPLWRSPNNWRLRGEWREYLQPEPCWGRGLVGWECRIR